MSALLDDSRPLDAREKALLERLLSDPFSYPLIFKAWHVRSLETSDLSLHMSNVLGLVDTLGIGEGQTGTVGLLNTGTVVLFAGATPPAHSLLCDGSAHATADFPGLFNVIGYAYGGAGGSFNVPNIAGPIAGTKYVIVT